MTMLRVSDLHHAFGGLVALDGVDIEVGAEEIVGIIGPNGCGKSTLLNSISGHLRPDRGCIEIGGIDASATGPARRARMGLTRSFQIARLMEPLSALDNVMLGLHRSPVRRRRARVAGAEAALELMGVADLAGQPVRLLSHGQRRRVELARALAADPKLLLLDEPTAGLTAGGMDQLIEVLRERSRNGTAIVLVAHDQRFIGCLCTSVVTMAAGTIQEVRRASPAFSVPVTVPLSVDDAPQEATA